ncbi:MAG: dihydrodipicolinate synthase family protein [Acidobacteriaceae bacterium]
MLLEGIFPAITTPFYPDGRLYLRKLEHNVERYSRTMAAGLVVLGSTGEAVMLSDEETRDVLRHAARAAAPDKVLVAALAARASARRRAWPSTPLAISMTPSWSARRTTMAR